MKIDKATMDRLVEIVDAAKATDEVEARYTASLAYDKFDTIVKYFRQSKTFVETETIDAELSAAIRANRSVGPVTVLGAW